MNALVHPAIRKASEENFTYIKGPRSGKDYRFYDSMYAVLDPDRRSPLSCISVANNSLSVDLWTGCAFQCAYCHVQGIQEDINPDDGKMRIRPIKRNEFTIDQILDALVIHPFFKKDKTIISIGTSSTEPFAIGEVLESTLEIMENLISRGYKNPFWIVTKAGIPEKAVDRLIKISKQVNKLILSMCYAGNNKKIEPAQNNRFKNIEKLQLDNSNISVNWYFRPFAREWFDDIENLELMFSNISKKYGQYIDSIVPGGLRWTEGIEYGVVETRGLTLPSNISKENNSKTLTGDDWVEFLNLSKKYFPDTPVYYHSSCALSLALERSNISMINLSKKDECEKSLCTFNQRNRCTIKDKLTKKAVQTELDAVGFGLEVLKFNPHDGELITNPSMHSLSPAIQTEVTHIISDLND
ncbi:hypothetical protein ACFVXR_27910 [Bacillus thuringiensis]|uniref:hypothetical protein n=2 Tax=Bacillus cereus group TaxID=86661 RepID=UPI000BF4E1EB|nr:hypothetical protein [Bacillus thuringiensis]PFJ10030.1 hypothetical protein COI87_19680 [Bacillus thuringiensis]PGX85646.1 hypothetical protein COE45_04355 [Bacillus thuringiensis]HDR8064187.1 hypothetical protein [Bacillus cereus]